ncbi:MAG: hypothetical protein QXD43_03575 [Candidatus Aenigmatarchaeota archaeon]
MNFKIIFDPKKSDAHITTQAYLESLSKENFYSLEEIENEFKRNASPFKLPDISRTLLSSPLLKKIPYTEFSEVIRKAQEDIEILLLKHNPRPWPNRIYVEHKIEFVVTEIPHIVDKLPVIEETKDGDTIYRKKVADVVVEKY